jgi:iron complex outermembrane recepter protein
MLYKAADADLSRPRIHPGGKLRYSPCIFFACLLVSNVQAQSAPAEKPASSKPSAQQETVVVTGTFAPLPETELDRSVTVIEASGQSSLYDNWVGYLQSTASLDLRQRAPNDVQGDLSIRGSSFGQKLVLLNGLRMDDVQSGHHDMDLPLPTQAVQRIEVLRGAGSTLYGSDAMAGSIDLITSQPEHSDFAFGAGVGNFGTNEQNGSASWFRKGFDTQLDAERDFSSGFRPDRDFRSLTLFSETGVKTALGNSLVMLGYGDKPFGADQFYGPFDSWERTKSWFVGIKQDFGSNTEFDFGFRRHTDEFVLFRNQPLIFENNHVDKSWQTDLRQRQPLTKNSTLFFGAEGIHESISSNNLGDHDRSRGAVYLDYDVRAIRRFSFSAGLREEIFSASHGELNPTLAGGVWLKPGWKLRASASRAFRLPSYTDLDYHDPANFGNPLLGPESAWDYEGGLLWAHSSTFKLDLTVFERRDRNVIDYVLRDCATVPSPELPLAASCSLQLAEIYHAENLQRLNFTGTEISGEIRLPRDGRLQIAYTALYGTREALGALQTKYTFNYPVNDGLFAWTGKLPGKVLARTQVRVVDRYSSDPYALWDAAVARDFNHFSAHLALQNISNTQYADIPGIVMPGRNVLVGLDYRLRGR